MELIKEKRAKNKSTMYLSDQYDLTKLCQVVSFYPLAQSLLKIHLNGGSFYDWIESISAQVIEEYADFDINNPDMTEQEKEIEGDVLLTAIFWLGHQKKDMEAHHDIKELHVQQRVVLCLLSNLSIINQITDSTNDEKACPFKIRTLNSESWDMNDIYMDSYFKVTSVEGTRTSGHLSDEVQSSHSLAGMVMQLFGKDKSKDN